MRSLQSDCMTKAWLLVRACARTQYHYRVTENRRGNSRASCASVLYPELAPGLIVERSGGYFNSAPGANQTRPNVEGRLRIESGTRILRVISRARRTCHLLLIRLWR